MKKIVFSFLCMLILGFPSCIKEGDNVTNYPPMVGVVGSLHSSMQPTIITERGTVLAPELMEHLFLDLFEGDAIVVSFSVDYDNQPSTEYSTVSNLLYEKVGKVTSVPTPGGESESGDFSLPIEDVEPYFLLENTLFIFFAHTAPSDQKFKYEMTYYRDEDAEIPTICLRAKKEGTGSKTEATISYLYAFDMRYFFMTYKDSENYVTFNINYKTGENEDGTDKYDIWTDNGNPFKIKIE